jgi:hypothetical protein
MYMDIGNKFIVNYSCTLLMRLNFVFDVAYSLSGIGVKILMSMECTWPPWRVLRSNQMNNVSLMCSRRRFNPKQMRNQCGC